MAESEKVELRERAISLVVDLGLAREEQVLAVEPLAGGVSSDIAKVVLQDRTVCVKFALEKLRVTDDWRAPVHRNFSEYQWLEIAAALAPKSALQVLGHSKTLNGFAMEFVHGRDVYLWKDATMARQADTGEAKTVGKVLGDLHSASRKKNFDTMPFQNAGDFEALRLDPYFRATAARNPEVSEVLSMLADDFFNVPQVLLHGDVSPKNIIFREHYPIFLDAECATMGDGAFDVAFCMSLLVLGAVHYREIRARQVDAAQEMWSAYSQSISWENPSELGARVTRFLPALMLARVDGKSPVEYLDDTKRNVVRATVVPMLLEPFLDVGEMCQAIASEIADLP